jgi:hypothetical protein
MTILPVLDAAIRSQRQLDALARPAADAGRTVAELSRIVDVPSIRRMQADVQPTVDLARRMQQEIAASLPSKETLAQFQASLPSPDVLAEFQRTTSEAQRQVHDAMLSILPDKHRMPDQPRTIPLTWTWSCSSDGFTYCNPRESEFFVDDRQSILDTTGSDPMPTRDRHVACVYPSSFRRDVGPFVASPKFCRQRYFMIVALAPHGHRATVRRAGQSKRSVVDGSPRRARALRATASGTEVPILMGTTTVQ